jgi:predicted metal-binding protein
MRQASSDDGANSGKARTMTTTIFVCDTCRWTADQTTAPCGRTGGEILADHVERLAEGVGGIEVRRQSCLMGCERHCNTAVCAPGKLSYVLGAFEPGAAAAEAVVEYALLHRDSETGQVAFRQWPQGVKGHFMARIPAIEGEG